MSPARAHIDLGLATDVVSQPPGATGKGGVVRPLKGIGDGFRPRETGLLLGGCGVMPDRKGRLVRENDGSESLVYQLSGRQCG